MVTHLNSHRVNEAAGQEREIDYDCFGLCSRKALVTWGWIATCAAFTWLAEIICFVCSSACKPGKPFLANGLGQGAERLPWWCCAVLLRTLLLCLQSVAGSSGSTALPAHRHSQAEVCEGMAKRREACGLLQSRELNRLRREQ